LGNPEPNIEVVVDLGLYSQSAILKATYKFTGDWYVQLVTTSENAITVIFTPKVSTDQSTNLKGEFLNELLDQRLREKINEETLPARNLIMAYALANLNTHDGDLTASA
jgi:His-Xaa-Ser system protein HxsD